MQVLLTHPFFWPHVARGAEREVHDVGSGLAARGHGVRLVTGRPTGLASRSSYGGMRVTYVRTPLPGVLARRGLQREGAFGAVVAGASLLSRADVVLAFHYADAVGAGVRRRPVVLKLTGAVPRDRVADQRVERGLLTRALGEAAEVWVNTRYAADAMAGWDVPMRVVPAGLDLSVFRPTAPRDPVPTVLCAASPDEPRKRVVDLVDAWPSVVEGLPAAQLVLAGHASSATRVALLHRLPGSVRSSVRFAGVLSGEELVAAYSRAHVVVMPSVHEALGLVTLEALACGTPVAGARSGATPELLAELGTGVLWEPLDPSACAAAVLAALDLGPGTPERCRASASRFALPGVLDTVEEGIARVVQR